MKLLFLPLLAAVTVNNLAPLPENDVVFRALNDEMKRSISRLQLNPYQKPYFISYGVRESDRVSVSASFGAVNSASHDRHRYLKIDVREGDYKLDSSNANGRGALSFFRDEIGGPGNELTVDDNYDSIRHEVWLKTDTAYKKAIEDLASKKAFLQEHDVKDLPDSMSKETPVVEIDKQGVLDTDLENRKAYSRRLSQIFKDFPKIQKSIVSFEESTWTRWFVNSEGFANRVSKPYVAVTVLAQARTEDGTSITDLEYIPAETFAGLPPEAEVEKRIRKFADRLVKLSVAKPVEQYRGPMLFEEQAAADFFADILQPNLGISPEPLNKQAQFMPTQKNALADRLNTRILPAFISVVDDPLTKQFGDTKITSCYTVDTDGVRAQKITLVDKGILKTFASSRVPTHEITHSNGHAAGHKGVTDNLYILSDTKSTPKQLREKLIQLGKDEGLKEVLIVKRLSNPLAVALDPESILSRAMSLFAGLAGGAKLSAPVEIYKLSVANGKEEIVRGAPFGNVTMRILRDIDSVGDDTKAYTQCGATKIFSLSANLENSTIITPSILVREVELQESPKESPHPPYSKNPYFEGKK
jgi:predicted Zn-dependent protease